MIYNNYHYRIPDGKGIRLIIDTDAKNEGDDQYAIVHALLSPRFDVRGIVATHFGTMKSKTSMMDSYHEIERLLDYMDFPQDLKYKGADKTIIEMDPAITPEGVQLIIDEAMRECDVPLYVIGLGAITNVAMAYKEQPEIAKRLTLVWIGGGAYPVGEPEYNLWNDIEAGRIVFDSNMEVWQIPRNTYGQVIVSMAELEEKVYPYGKIGKYLFEQMVSFGCSEWGVKTPRTGEYWRLGDSPAVGVLLFPHDNYYEIKEAPEINDDMTYRESKNHHPIRVYHTIDTRVVMEDFYAKLHIFARKKGEIC